MSSAVALLNRLSIGGRLVFLRSKQQRLFTSRVSDTVNNQKEESNEKQENGEPPKDEQMVSTVEDVPTEEEDPNVEMVDMWNKDAPAGPEWNGPRGYEPTRHGDWSRGGRVSDF